MSDEQIVVEWIATADKMVGILDRLEKKLGDQEKQLEKIGKTSQKAADAAAGSFNAMEQELRETEAALKKMEVGTAAFAAQKKRVDELRQSLKGVKDDLNVTASGVGTALSGGIAKVTQLVAGMMTFQKAVEAIVGELKKAEEIKIQAALTTRDFEQAIADMTINIGAKNVPEARRMILEESPKIGATPSAMANLVGLEISGGAENI